MLIRRETAADRKSADTVQRAAFGRPTEARLADRLRSEGHVAPVLCLVAVIDDVVVGHVVCSWGRLEDRPLLALGPIAVAPDLQGRGVGSNLVQSVLTGADVLGEPVMVLLGNPVYYGRFGFVPSTQLGIDPPNPAWGPAFQARALSQHTPALRGRFTYAAPFDEVD